MTVLTENAFVYDKAHMKTQETVTNNAAPKAGMEAVTYANNNVNQLVSSTGPARNYVYDADGNMTQWYTPEGYAATATYDAENRMTTASYTDGTGTVHRASFSYGPEGFVAKQVVDGVETRFIRDGYYCLQERNGANSVTRAYVWDHVSPGGIGGLLEMTKNGKHYNYYYDGKGNVSACINADPNLSQTDGEFVYYAYDSFGNQVSQTGTLEQPYRFSTKYYYAGYGLYDYGYRFYNPMVGKWMTRDPIGEEGGLNLYGMVYNSPINILDPFGLFGENSAEASVINLLLRGRVSEAAEIARVLPAVPGTAKILNLINNIQFQISQILNKPAAQVEEGNCADVANNIYKIFNNAGLNPRIITILDKYKALRWLDANGNLITTRGWHKSVQVGDFVYDALTGPNGMEYTNYIKMLQSRGVEPVIP